MSMSRDELLSRIEGDATPGAKRRIRSLFDDACSPSMTMNPVRSKASEALRVWQTRLITSGLPILSLNGIRMLVRKLGTVPPDTEIEQYGFTGKRFAGSVFFDGTSGRFLGDTIVKRHAKSQEMIALEDQLIRPSRKSA